jgi:hypothetical protein
MNNLCMTMFMSTFEEEDRACDFLHLGSGWKASLEGSGESTVKKLYRACQDADLFRAEMSKHSAQSVRLELKAPKAYGGLVYRQGSNRAMPYTRDNKGVRPDQERLRRVGERSACTENCRNQEQYVQSCSQADFENLSLGPGFPFFDALDLHI